MSHSYSHLSGVPALLVLVFVILLCHRALISTYHLYHFLVLKCFLLYIHTLCWGHAQGSLSGVVLAGGPRKVHESLSKPAMEGVKLEVVQQQKPGQVVKVHDPYVVLVRGGATHSSSNMESCRDIELRSLAQQVYLRLDR